MDTNFQAADRSCEGNGREDLIEQIRALQHRVEVLATTAGAARLGSPQPAEIPPEAKHAVRTIVQLRAHRRSVFGPALFGEPSWDILLELFDAHLKGRSECVSSLCIASGVPGTTALRRIGDLEREGFIIRSADPKDRRRFYLELTEKGVDAMSKVFTTMKIAPGN
jgi:DNA-binding MarR family transcriptional regulator